MSDTMLERVARAIFETWAAEGNSDVTWAELLKMRDGDGYQEGKRMYALAIKEARAAIEAMALVDAKALIVAAAAEAKYDGRVFSALGAADKKRYIGRLDLTLEAYFAALSEAQSTGEKK
jgi:hypothetical protein